MIDEKTAVIQNPVPRKSVYLFSDFEYSDKYLVIPELMPPLEKISTILVKLFNWPKMAIPAGPITDAMILMLIRPVAILMMVEIPFKNETLTRSVFRIFFMELSIEATLAFLIPTVYHLSYEKFHDFRILKRRGICKYLYSLLIFNGFNIF